MNILGKCYLTGRGVKQDYTIAVEWFQKSSKINHAYAQMNLGDCYKNGWGVDKNY